MLVRDGGAHFQNNRICYFESTITALTLEENGREKKWEVCALPKRHGYNPCDGAIARVSQCARKDAVAGNAPSGPTDWADMVNMNPNFCNAKGYIFEKIDRNPALFPNLNDFKGIQAEAYCEFQYFQESKQMKTLQH
jgi:hypothetical protein